MRNRPRKSARYLSLYAVSQEYGGPEEGGWYWNRLRYTGKSFRLRRRVTRAYGAHLERTLKRLHGWTSAYPYTSVLGGEDARVSYERTRGERRRTSAPGWDWPARSLTTLSGRCISLGDRVRVRTRQGTKGFGDVVGFRHNSRGELRVLVGMDTDTRYARTERTAEWRTSDGPVTALAAHPGSVQVCK